jgi:hypothetical protein
VSQPCCVLLGSARGGHFSKGLAGYNIGHFQQFLKNTCSVAAKILTVDFVVCALAVKKNQGRFRHVGSDHSLVRLINTLQRVENCIADEANKHTVEA